VNAAPTVLQLAGLSVEFDSAVGARRVVDDVSLEVRRGEVLGIVGESGSGKTLTAQSLIGLAPAAARVRWRELLIDSTRVASGTAAEFAALRGGRVGMVFQDAMAALNPVRTIGWHLSEALRYHGGGDREAALRRGEEALAAVGIPSPRARLDAYPHELSGGLRQRCMIALALINSPSLVIADEPTTALDATVELEVLDVLRARTRDCGVILITHDLALAAEFCDHIAVMRAGRIVERGEAAALTSAPAEPYTQALLASAPAFDRPYFEQAAAPSRAGSEALRAEAVTVSFNSNGRRVVALDGASLTVQSGETLAIVGESGSGKSTLARALSGQLKMESGQVFVDGEALPAAPRAARRAWRRRIQVVFQDPYSSLDPRWRIAATLREADLATDTSATLQRVGLPEDFSARFPSQLSGGQRQRIGLARALIVSARVVIADEPVSALDVSVQAEIVRLIRETQHGSGFALLFISHDMPLVSHVAERTAVMYLGRIVEEGPTKALIEAPRHPYTAALIAASAPARLLAEPARAAVSGERASLLAPPPGCAFHPRCPLVADRCRTESPPLIDDGTRRVACHRAGEVAPPLSRRTYS
jgi:peptide/nickel transport system ATP-binding protein